MLSLVLVPYLLLPIYGSKVIATTTTTTNPFLPPQASELLSVIEEGSSSNYSSSDNSGGSTKAGTMTYTLSHTKPLRPGRGPSRLIKKVELEG